MKLRHRKMARAAWRKLGFFYFTADGDEIAGPTLAVERWHRNYRGMR